MKREWIGVVLSSKYTWLDIAQDSAVLPRRSAEVAALEIGHVRCESRNEALAGVL